MCTGVCTRLYRRKLCFTAVLRRFTPLFFYSVFYAVLRRFTPFLRKEGKRCRNGAGNEKTVRNGVETVRKVIKHAVKHGKSIKA